MTFNPILSGFHGAKGTTPTDVRLDSVVKFIRSPKSARLIDVIRADLKAGRKKEADEKKRRLLAIIFSGRYSKRSDRDWVTSSGIICCDLDHIPMDQLESIRAQLAAFKWVCLIFVSPSGNGLKICVRVSGLNEANASEYLKAWKAVTKWLHTLNLVNDPSTKNPSRLCFLSHDPRIYHNEDPEHFPIETFSEQEGEIGQVSAQMARSDENIPLDLPASRFSFENIAKNSAPAVEGENGDPSTFSICCKARDIGLSEECTFDILEAHWNHRCRPPWPENELRLKIKNAFRYAQNPSPGSESPAADFKPVLQSEEKNAALELAKKSSPCALNELGNAERLKLRSGDRLRYVRDRGEWLFWTGVKWSNEYQDAVERSAMAMARAIDDEVIIEPDDNRRKELRLHAQRSQSARGIHAALDLCRSLKGISINSDQFDTNPWLLNCKNGTLDLRTGVLSPHNRDQHITKCIAVNYDPDARSPIFDRFMVESTGGDADLAEFICRAKGYSLTGSTTEERLFFLHGPAGSGKSTLVEAIKAVLADYARTADFAAFVQKAFSGPRPDIARLASARFVLSIEVDDGQKLAEGLVKTLTGGDVVTARKLYQNEFEFKPQFKLWLVANDKPRVRDSDSGMWRRILLVPFEHVVPPEKRDPAIKAALTDPTIAGPAILAWMVRGAQRWLADGLKIPTSVVSATTAYRQEMDPLKTFIEDRCHLGTEPQDFIQITYFRSAYDTYCRESGQRFPLGPREFNKRLEAKGCKQDGKWIDGKTRRCWIGVRLLREDESPVASSDQNSPVTDDFWGGDQT